MSLVAQWLRICLPMQGTRVQSPLREWRFHMQQHFYWAHRPQLQKCTCLNEEPNLHTTMKTECSQKRMEKNMISIWPFLKWLNIHDSEIKHTLKKNMHDSALHIFPRKMIMSTQKFTLWMFTAALFTYYSQQVGTMQVSINRRMDNQNEIYTYNRILFSHKKE